MPHAKAQRTPRESDPLFNGLEADRTVLVANQIAFGGTIEREHPCPRVSQFETINILASFAPWREAS